MPAELSEVAARPRKSHIISMYAVMKAIYCVLLASGQLQGSQAVSARWIWPVADAIVCLDL